MADPEALIDDFLADALVADAAAWPPTWSGAATRDVFLERLRYHGIAGLLLENGKNAFPDIVTQELRDQSIAQAMWESRHMQLIGVLLSELAQVDVPAIILKGTAIAYDLYALPHTRSRADTDLLVEEDHLPQARRALSCVGFRREQNFEGRADDLYTQEVWRFAANGPIHEIDLHWQAMNSMALRHALPFDDCAADARALPELHPKALAMARSNMLIHACLHRATNRLSPYFVGETKYYGGDRLIWTYDIHLLSNALSEAEWSHFCSNALRKGLAPICLDGLKFVSQRLGTMVPPYVLERLASANTETRASVYLLRSGPAGRAIEDLKAVAGLSRKARYLVGRALPSASFLRAKYPNSDEVSLPLLYIRRFAELFRKRPDRVDL
jgi:hypothetical protein